MLVEVAAVFSRHDAIRSFFVVLPHVKVKVTSDRLELRIAGQISRVVHTPMFLLLVDVGEVRVRTKFTLRASVVHRRPVVLFTDIGQVFSIERVVTAEHVAFVGGLVEELSSRSSQLLGRRQLGLVSGEPR